MIFEPIEHWPGNLTPNSQRKRAPFRTSFQKTIDLLDKELRALSAKNVVLQLRLDRSQILRDGSRPYSTATPAHPGVILTFECAHGTLSYPCDTFEHWHDNLRAIALGLEALRKVARYGITSSGQQYTGWRKIGGSVAPPQPQMSPYEAAEILLTKSCLIDHYSIDDILESKEAFKDCFLTAAKLHHPDRGGDHETMNKINSARDVIKAFYN